MIITDPNPTGQVIANPDPDPVRLKVSDPRQIRIRKTIYYQMIWVPVYDDIKKAIWRITMTVTFRVLMSSLSCRIRA